MTQPADMSEPAGTTPPAGDAWHPGLQSDIPQALWPLVTLYRSENATVSYTVARELADLTGLKVLELVAIRPERLVVHALLVRVTADLSVPDGPDYEVLGINLRGMADTIYRSHMQPEMASIVALFESEKDKAASYIAEQLADKAYWRSSGQSSGHYARQSSDRSPPVVADKQTESSGPAPKPSLLRRLFGKTALVAQTQTQIQSQTPSPAVSQEETVELTAIRQWKALLPECDDPLRHACLKALIKTVDAVVAHRGRLIPDAALIRNIIVNQVTNTHGADVIEAFIEPIWQRAIDAEGYRRLPAQDKPVIMNVKGASASGKSTIRPQQRQLAGKLGIPWEDFALISPDYWRKYLLEYESLGEDYKYGAMLTGRELEIIDRKLDRYMAGKAASGTVSHLLIDRFRFDSFNVSIDKADDSRLLSRFGDRVFLFFMVTHPSETVARAWERGRKTGRYKAVDDLLYHNVEAFTGMPSLFLSWVDSKDKEIHFEFLDNDVAKGQLPHTAAFGWNNSLTILDPGLPVNIDRYRRVNIAAQKADEVLQSTTGNAADDTPFIVRCAQRVPHIVFADQDTAQPYATVIDGKLAWWDYDYIQGRPDTEDLLSTLAALGYPDTRCTASPDATPISIDVEKEKSVTVGSWCETETAGV
jgi:hypothetical protein